MRVQVSGFWVQKQCNPVPTCRHLLARTQLDRLRLATDMLPVKVTDRQADTPTFIGCWEQQPFGYTGLSGTVAATATVRCCVLDALGRAGPTEQTTAVNIGQMSDRHRHD
jgi:hypothetical protein